MKWLQKLFRFDSGESKDGDRLEIAESYLESQATSGLVRHYRADAVVDILEQKAGVRVTIAEAIELVERVRARRGWPPRSIFFGLYRGE